MSEEATDAVDPQQTPIESEEQPIEAGEVTDEGQDAAQETPEKSKDDDLPAGVRKSIARATRQKHDAIRRAEAAEAKLSEFEKRLAAIENPPKPRPQLDEFETREAYEDALFEWRDEQSQRQAESAQPKQEQQESPVDPDLVEDWSESVQAAKSTYTDFESVALNPNLPVSPEMGSILMEMDRGADVLYQLGKTPDEAARIAQLPPLAAARELGKIEATLGQHKPKPSSKAPPPIDPVGGTADATIDPEKLPFDEYVKWREGRNK